jgi:hypothetical protein
VRDERLGGTTWRSGQASDERPKTQIRTVLGERGEGARVAGDLEVGGALGRREGRGRDGDGARRRDDLGAVDEVARVVAEHGELGHRRLEAVRHQLLLVDEALPDARRARVARERKVGLEAQLARVGALGERERRHDLAGVVARPREAGALEQHLEEDLGVHHERRLCGSGSATCRASRARRPAAHRVERRGVDRLVDLVRARDAVRGEERDDLERRKVAGVLEARQDLVDAVLRLGDQAVDGRDRVVRPAGHELQARRAGAVGERHRARELDEVAGADRGVLGEEGDQVVDAVVDAVVRREVGLDGREQEHGAVRSTSAVGARSVRRTRDGRRSSAYALGPLLWLMAMASWKVRRMTSWAGGRLVSHVANAGEQ